MGSPSTGVRMELTHRDLDHTPDDGNRYEVVDGALHVTPFPSYRHQNAQTELVAILRNHTREHRLGKVFAAGLKVVLAEPTGVGPDVVYIAAARMDQMQDDGFYGAPDLVVEILSSTPLLDRVVKFQTYARAGVAHYWIVDPVAQTLEAYVLEGGRYRLAARHQGEEDFAPAVFPGLTIALRELWT